MKFPVSNPRGSALIIVLWIAFGLVAITLYFANSMSSELRASDNRVSGLVAEQAIEGAARYVTHILANQLTNGTVPDLTTYGSRAMPVGDAHFWFIGRDPDATTTPSQVYFGLVDEASKLNLNAVAATNLVLLPVLNLTDALAANIVDWRNPNGTTSANGDGPSAYSLLQPSYLCKSAPYETVDELRLVYGMTMDLLTGEDLNHNGLLDPNEVDDNHNGIADPGLLDYVTVFSREPNVLTNGSPRANVNNRNQELAPLLQQSFGTTRANEILARLGPPGVPIRSPLEFFVLSRMKAEEFAVIELLITTTANTNDIIGRVNVNTAGAAVLACLPGLDADKAQQLVDYRVANPDALGSVAWVRSVLSQGDATRVGPYITTHSYQFTADIAALGPYGRGYRRERFVFDTSSGTPKIIFRQDLSHLGWALGKDVRQTWLAQATP